MIISEILVKQKDCPHTETSEKFWDLFILIMHTTYDGSRQNMFSFFYSSDESNLENAIKFFASRSQISNLTVISKQNRIANLFYSSVPTSMFRKLNNIGFRVHPVVVHKGIEKWFFINNENPVRADEINDENTRVVSIQTISQKKFFLDYSAIFYELNLMNVINRISEVETRVISSAIELGYFEWPRKINLSKLGMKLGIPKSTLSYHFRSIEKKMFQVLMVNNDISKF
ncbi:MAG: helix-turn-helix domain-containing protein [Thermoplasmata archaeon]